MKVNSYIRQRGEMVPVEVELSLAPGLPQFHFIGLPDTAIRESALRIRSAIREQDFDLPKAQQVLVHLKSTHLKKTSRGLDLAIAAALLWETEQLSKPPEVPIVYGELTLKGEAVMPDDADELEPESDRTIITGAGKTDVGYRSIRLGELRDLALQIEPIEAKPTPKFSRPLAKVDEVPRAAARLAAIVAAGEHAVLIAGPQGTGKTTLVELITTLIDEPSIDEFESMRKIWKRAGQTLQWRPILKPHHSITPLAMIGGGSNLWAGEITRANGGVLIMDELLEFDPLIQEALREPVESGVISLVRAGNSKSYPAQLLLLATTNLCSCGKFVPHAKNHCRCSRAQRGRVLNRLKGPFVDRFSILALSDSWAGSGTEEIDAVCVSSVQEETQRAIEFRKSRGQTVPNARADASELGKTLTDFQRKNLRHTGSRRRQNALLRVARTIADLRGEPLIEEVDLAEAGALTLNTHLQLEEWRE
jgi:magnesium chelatase family protein